MAGEHEERHHFWWVCLQDAPLPASGSQGSCSRKESVVGVGEEVGLSEGVWRRRWGHVFRESLLQGKASKERTPIEITMLSNVILKLNKSNHACVC